MGLRLQKRVKIAKGVNLNLSKKGVGISFGVKGAHVGIGPRGVRTSVGIPGTGIRYEKQSSRKKNPRPKRGTKNVKAKAGIIDNGKKVHEETIRVPVQKRKKGCLGCCTLPLISVASVGALLAMVLH